MLTLSAISGMNFDALATEVADRIVAMQSCVVECPQCNCQMLPFRVEGVLRGMECPKCLYGSTVEFDTEFKRAADQVRSALRPTELR